nr:unnamed protein product [Callosobruchus analis]
MTLTVATFLDPRFKNIDLYDEHIAERTRNFIKNSLVAIMEKENKVSQLPCSHLQADTSEDDSFSIWSQFDREASQLKPVGMNIRSKAILENDLIEIEQKFVEEQNHLKEQLKDQKEQLYLMHTEMLKVEEKNRNLSEMIAAYQKQIKELETEIKELRSVEIEMLTSLSSLEESNDTYIKHIDMLQKEADVAILAENLCHSSEKNTIYQGSLITNTETEEADPVAAAHSTTEQSDVMGSRKEDVHDKQGVRKILVVGDELARNIAKWLSSCLSEADFRTSGIVMPKAELCDIINILFNNTTIFGQSDAIIVIFKSSNVSNHNLLRNALKKLLSCCNYTNLLILVQYNLRDDIQLHNFISKKIKSFKAYKHQLCDTF